ncbi:PSD1 and planctomycete cytochrome C domain-containing protein [Rubinisphaera margarita]|uniref:PSD1 and planctomycete cytochrome C domain-containing protein n=1 Tax=Rubinisphaera margarita TaxID=2909586 RepID=UPI001EE7BA89|nr:PSD1 and planctomycete cytochrome C domain-containing protein [Rubinisphaera margarita]MCG6156078.1 PSD1 and planctomycete cytochrome C domain-containing protein [Rubinisphaera margarita]
MDLLRYATLGLMLVSVSTARAADIDFNRDIRPVLSDKCFLCHGPDETTREVGLRLDVRENAVEYGALVPGDAAASAIIERITSTDPDLVMPPPSTDKTMTPAEVAKMRQWIEQGAEYDQHWAFVPPERPELPEVENEALVHSPIDRFVLARLEKEGMSFSSQADRSTMIRRLYLDLTGLPPTLAAQHRWQNEPAADWDAKLVEHLLASPHYGEHWARWWLDAARYADSDGYEKDKQRSVWFYRDWVIDALNSNKPYNEFVIEQIAGDLIPGADQQSRIATGFLRNSMINEEGGADPEQFRVEGMFDRMDAIGKSILGLTTQCAQCHTHKYDPLQQSEYYQMFAAINGFHEAITTVYTPEQQEERKQIHARMASLEEQVKNRYPEWKQELKEWEKHLAEQQVDWQTVVPTEIPFEGQKFRILDDGSVLSESFAPAKSTVVLGTTLPAQEIKAVRLDLLTHPQLPHNGPGRSLYGTGALTEFEVNVTPKGEKVRKVKFVRAMADFNPAESHLPDAFRENDAENDHRVTGPIEYAIDGEKKTAWTTDIDPGRRNQDMHAIFVPEEPLNFDQEFELSWRLVQTHGGSNSDDNDSYIMGRYRFSVSDQDIPGEQTIPSPVEAVLAVPVEERTPQQWTTLLHHWRKTRPELAGVNAEFEELWKSYPAGHSQLTAQEMGEGRETFVMERGDFLSPGDQVTPGAPSFLNPFQDTEAPDRLDFARWLVSRDSPTTARALVNRIWQAYFENGIVSTPEDLGSQSPPPSHPLLIDWLAVEFMESGWDLKHLHRLIVTSNTYRQTSSASEQRRQKDPVNTLLSRGARFRVDAEIVRDIALTASGLLNPELGGESIYPPAPEFLFQPPASYGPKNWPLSPVEQQRRRSLYVHKYRSVPYPPLQVFDIPKGDAACVRRTRSNTPLQALVLLNEPQFVSFAQALTKRLLDESNGTDADRIQYGYRLALSREASPEEVEILTELLNAQRERIAADELKLDLLVDDEFCRTEVQRSEFAAWLIVARTLLNLDETITRQ